MGHGALAQDSAARATWTEQYLRDADTAARRGDRVAALQLYQSAIIYSPAEPEPYNRLAEFYAMADESDMAGKYFGIALDVDPANPLALKGLALLALAAGDVELARAHHQILVQACGPACPEAAEIEAALAVGVSASNPGGAAN